MAANTIVSLTADYEQIPLVDPFVLSIRQATYANIVRWRLRLQSGSEYLGESVPVQYVTGESPESVLRCAADFQGHVIGRSVDDLSTISHDLLKAFPTDFAARAGVEIALLNAVSDLRGLQPFEFFGGKLRQVETDITITKVTNAMEIAERYAALGFRIFKFKVGGSDSSEDLGHLREFHTRLPNARIRLDANQGFTSEEALRFIEEIGRSRIPIELIEQPVSKEDFGALDLVAARSAIPIIADESCKTPEDALRLFAETAVHGVNVKVMKSGLFGAREIAEIAMQANKKLMIGCMLETPVGIAASLALACGTGAFEFVDLDGHILVQQRGANEEFHSEGPILKVLEPLRGRSLRAPIDR